MPAILAPWPREQTSPTRNGRRSKAESSAQARSWRWSTEASSTSFKEANALAHHLRDAHEHSDSVLVRDLAGGHERPFGITASPEEVERSTVATLEQAEAILRAKTPEELAAYRQFVLEVAGSVAEAAKGVSPQENTALERIRAALGAEDAT